MKYFWRIIALAVLIFTFAVPTALAKKLHIISRQEWGANEEWTLEKAEPPPPETSTGEQNGDDHGPDDAQEQDP
jgi:hypothetical protein